MVPAQAPSTTLGSPGPEVVTASTAVPTCGLTVGKEPGVLDYSPRGP